MVITKEAADSGSGAMLEITVSEWWDLGREKTEDVRIGQDRFCRMNDPLNGSKWSSCIFFEMKKGDQGGWLEYKLSESQSHLDAIVTLRVSSRNVFTFQDFMGDTARFEHDNDLWNYNLII